MRTREHFLIKKKDTEFTWTYLHWQGMSQGDRGCTSSAPRSTTESRCYNLTTLAAKTDRMFKFTLFKIYFWGIFPSPNVVFKLWTCEIHLTDRWHIPSEISGVKTHLFYIILQINKCPLCQTQLILSRLKCHLQITQRFRSEGSQLDIPATIKAGLLGGRIDLKQEGIPFWDKCWNETFRLSSSISFNFKRSLLSSVFYFLCVQQDIKVLMSPHKVSQDRERFFFSIYWLSFSTNDNRLLVRPHKKLKHMFSPYW